MSFVISIDFFELLSNSSRRRREGEGSTATGLSTREGAYSRS
jgi:hypothetical protein